METQNRTEKNLVIRPSKGVGPESSGEKRRMLKEDLKITYAKLLRETDTPEDVITTMMETIDRMIGFTEPRRALKERKLTAAEKLAKFADINYMRRELPIKAKYFLGSFIEDKPDFDRPIIKYLDPTAFDIDLIRVALGKRQSLLEMTSDQLLEASKEEIQSRGYSTFYIVSNSGFLRMRIPTVVNDVNFSLKVDPSGIEGVGSIISAELS